MKYLSLVGALLLGTATVPAAAADVGLSISIGQPGFYGQIDLGNAGRPPVIYAQPRIIQRGGQDSREPLYLRVPPAHARDWRRYCGNYNACGRPVYFVRDDWYTKVYAPRYREQHQDSRGDNRGDNRNDNRGDGRDNGRDGDHGNNGQGNNKGRRND